MKKIILSFLFFVFILFLIDCHAEQISGEYIIKTSNFKSVRLHRFFSTKSKFRRIISEIDGKFKHVQLDDSSLQILKNDFKNEIEYIEPNYIYKINESEELRKPTRRRTVRASSETQWGLDAINAKDAWSITKGDRSVIVAIIDTGIDCNHPALKDHCLVGFDFVNNRVGAKDDNGHGTHCAGIVAANSYQANGVAPNVTVLAIKFMGANGSGSLDAVMKGIKYAVKNGAKILSNSWGGYSYSQALVDTIKEATDNGAIFIAAAGNESNDNDSEYPSYPSSYKIDEIISVAAIDKNNQLASFSNFGLTSVHVAGPGVSILSTFPNNRLVSLSGTSMATPFISGVAALILSKYQDATVIEIKNRILNNVKIIPELKSSISTSGIIDAYQSLR